ncbi:tetratricopeptide repeat protein [Streptomyces sp. NBC_00151]|uniref:tetratricopeptide repeat protein n=1 Tax=Streptomyces sp. NBC_00151 TaxID=2975669 RepID=UPI002DD96705|nr:tetratricopeptide repeat protein [Streptomyces sp. NBC_00151]WRZ39222.1 tetratricopeptide repeat protein [Streptomyces sp. NBC_00151]
MTPAMDFDTLRRAMADNYEQPEGPGRNACAEQLLVEAERLNIPLAVIEALGHQLKVYNYSSEKGKMFVPFARLLRMWDERPEDFDEFEIHSLHWVFKWMSAGMLDQPHVPLASIEKWLGEMERRYRLAGHSERAVRGAEFSVAAHLGDLERAERAYTAWLAADRDAMADCHACELHGQGWWRAVRGADEEALELWAPVLRGEYTCAHEPHTVLASSLLPLLRLGRIEEARAHHLRGFRLVRAMESMRGAFADHVEFCALTGNEARALELLAERPAYFTDSGDPRSRLDFMSVVALAMDRLTALGLGGQPVPGPAGRGWTAAELAVHARGEALALAARFDERNGTSYVGERARARMDQPVLVGRLPLGVRSAAPARSGSRPPTPVPALLGEAGAAEPGLDALLAEARRLSALRDPDAVEAWAAVSRAAEGQELAVRDRAEIADHAAMGRGPQGAALFHRAAGLYAEAGDPGEALAARSRAAYVQALSGGSAEALEVVAELREQVLALFARGGTGVSQTASVLVSRARTLMHRVDELETGAVSGRTPAESDTGSGSEAAVMAAADEAARELLALAEAHAGDDVGLASRAAEAYAMLGELAARADDAEAAAGLLRRAVDGFVAAGLPWFAVEYESRLAGIATHLGDMEAAERATRDALDHGGSHLEPMGHAQLHLRLAETLAATGRFGPASEHALEAAHWADEAGEAATFGAWARHHLGGFLLRLGRWAEAAEILESALPDLTAEMHGEGAIVQTRWWLGDCLTELGEHRDAAEHWLRAADTARHWPEQRDHAMLANLAAEALTHAGMTAQADQAYARAGDLWRELGNVDGLVRALRARAWGAARRDGGLDEARELMAEAIQECVSAAKGRPAGPDSPGAGQPGGADGSSEAGTARADRGAGAGDGDESEDAEAGRRLVAELGHTHRQFGDLVARSVPDDAEEAVVREAFEEALGHMGRAITVFASLGDSLLGARTGAELAAGRLEADLGRHGAAAARARTVLAVCDRLDAETAGARRAEAEKMRELTGKAG